MYYIILPLLCLLFFSSGAVNLWPQLGWPGKDAGRETTMEALEAAKAGRWEVFNLGESHGGSSIAGWFTSWKKTITRDDFRVPPEIPEMWGFEWQKWEEKAEFTRTMMRPVVVRHLRLCFLAPVHWKNVPKGLFADLMTPRNMPISSCKRGRGLLTLLKVVFICTA